MSRFEWGLCVWFGFVAIFLALELPANWNLVPWPTLSETSWDAEAWWEPVRLGLLLFLVCLLAHICFRLTAAALICAAIGTVAVGLTHFLTS